MNLPSLLLLATGLTTLALPTHLHAAKEKAPASPEATAATPAVDPEQAKLSAAKRKVHELPEIASAQQQAKADRALASKSAAEYKHARAKAAESETAYRKAYEEALTKADPEAADILKKQRAAFREKMLKARGDKNTAAGKKVSAVDDEGPEATAEKSEG